MSTRAVLAMLYGAACETAESATRILRAPSSSQKRRASHSTSLQWPGTEFQTSESWTVLRDWTVLRVLVMRRQRALYSIIRIQLNSSSESSSSSSSAGSRLPSGPLRLLPSRPESFLHEREPVTFSTWGAPEELPAAWL